MIKATQVRFYFCKEAAAATTTEGFGRCKVLGMVSFLGPEVAAV